SYIQKLLVTREEKIDIKLHILPAKDITSNIKPQSMNLAMIISNADVAPRVKVVRTKKQEIKDKETQVEDSVIAGASAHSITVTPGQLVVDFDGTKTMYVHCLNVEEAAETLDRDQTRRLKALKRIRGHD